MNTNTNSNLLKIAIVGMTGSGKTVLVSTLATRMTQITLEDIYLAPFGNNRRQTIKYVQSNWQTLNNGQWPASTPAGELIKLRWELNTKNCQASVQFLDCAGQDIRSLFRTEKFNPASLNGDLRTVYNSINSANVLILLVNMKDLLATWDATNEILDLDQMIHTLQQRNDIPRRIAVVFSQYDKYKPEVDQKFNGDFLEYVRHYIPNLYGQYKWFHNFEIIPVAAVNDTRIVVENGEVKQYPIPNFSSYNLEELIHWIADSVEQLNVEIEETELSKHQQREADERRRREEEQARQREAEEQERKRQEEEKRRQREAEEQEKKRQEEEKRRQREAEEYVKRQREETHRAEVSERIWNRGVLIVAIIIFLSLGSFAVYNLMQPKEGTYQWYLLEAKKGNVDAQYKLGNCYYNGDGVVKNYIESVKWYYKAAEKGNVDAQYKLGNCYYYGNGVAKNYTEAVNWYHKAADTGKVDAQHKLGICYYYGNGVVKNYTEAVNWYRKAAEQGYSDAQNMLGVCYAKGEGITEDKAEAVIWYHKAAEQGHVYAQYNLGNCFFSGDGISEDKVQAVKWYRKAAEQGDSDAQNKLAYCLASGDGVEENKEESAKWYRKSAEQGNVDSQNQIGLCYEFGIGVDIDEAEAVKWYNKAIEQGSEDAKRSLENYNTKKRELIDKKVNTISWTITIIMFIVMVIAAFFRKDR